MTPAQHARAKEIFLAASARPAAERAAFLDAQCGSDATLRAHLDELLRHHSALATAPAAAEPTGDTPVGSAAPRLFDAGTIVAGRYRMVAPIGRGGMGEVYRADDLVISQPVALKFLPSAFGNNPAWLERLLRELRLARRVTHPNICRLHDVDVDDATGAVFLSMELIPGDNLRTLLQRIGRYSEERAITVARQLCVALAAAHAAGVLHRDLKPANIMIDDTGAVRVTDFGLAAALGYADPHEARAGTPAYMAPERFAGTDASPQSDIYAFGLVLHELLTGHPAIEADSAEGYARQHQTARPTPVRERVPDLDPRWDSLIQQCLAKDPHERPASMLDVAAALPDTDPLAVALAAGVTPSPRQVALAARPTPLRPATATGLVALLAVLLAGVGLLLEASSAGVLLRGSKPPVVLADQASQVARELGGADGTRVATGYALASLGGLRRSSAVVALPETLTLADAGPRTPLFWYRRSPNSLAPTNAVAVTFGSARTTLNDPPRTTPGSVAVVLSGSGALRAFESVPTPGRTGHAPDWSYFFEQAGLAFSDFAATEPLLTARSFPVEPHAWLRRQPTANADAALRVEAAGIAGQPVFFAVLTPTADTVSNTWQAASRRTISINARLALLILALAAAIPIARRHLAAGRGDPRGATRLSLFVLVTRIIAWALGASHAPELEAEARLLLFGLLGAMFEAGVIGLLYLALEPYVRRFWPQTVRTWSHLLRGHAPDSRVARDTLIGLLLGSALAALTAVDRYLPDWLGWTAHPPLQIRDWLTMMLGTRHTLAAVLDAVLLALYHALLLVILLAFAWRLLRRRWPAIGLTALVAAPMYLPLMSHPVASWLPLGLSLVLTLWAATRYGLAVLIGAIFTLQLLTTLPLDFQPGAWAWETTLLVLAALLGVAVGAAVLASRPQAIPRPAWR